MSFAYLRIVPRDLFVGSAQKRSMANPCQKNPCRNIARAIVNRCVKLSNDDFECRCQRHFHWDDETNACLDEGMLFQTYVAFISLCLWGEMTIVTAIITCFYFTEDKRETLDPCAKKCQNIAGAIVNSCEVLENGDFQCDCQKYFAWDDQTNSCIKSM
jgi:hypothetical protein